MRKKYILFVFSLATLPFVASAQTIPYGISSDTFKVVIYNTDSFVNPITYNFHPLLDTVQARVKVYYYKPLNYDSMQSPFLIGIHGQYGTGSGAINMLQAIADRRGVLIIAPVMPQNGEGIFWEIWGPTQLAYGYVTKSNWVDCVGWLSAYYGFWWPPVMKQIYRHALIRENRNSVFVYLTGFSMGGQFTSRYMLIRQAIPDSIPIINTVSANAFYYTFCTDTLQGIPMPYACGILQDPKSIFCNDCACWKDSTQCCFYADTAYNPLPIKCNDHVIQYYNENYGVLIGTADTASNGAGCALPQGANRYERARNFYNFSDTNAITRGTTLQWKYDSIIGIDHNGTLMYNTKRDTADTSTIAETLLFDTPWHPVPSLAPIASFTASPTIVSLPSAAVQFTNNSINATSYLWDFGDSYGSTNINPTHTYYVADTFTVKLKVTSGSGCENEMLKRNYIIVKSASGINQLATGNGQLAIYPNPTSGEFTLQLATGNWQAASIEIYNVFGEKVYSTSNIKHQTPNKIDLSSHAAGIYFIELKTSKGNYHGKVVKK